MSYSVQIKVRGIWVTVNNTVPDLNRAADIAADAYRCSPDKEARIIEQKEDT